MTKSQLKSTLIQVGFGKLKQYEKLILRMNEKEVIVCPPQNHLKDRRIIQSKTMDKTTEEGYE